MTLEPMHSGEDCDLIGCIGLLTNSFGNFPPVSLLRQSVIRLLTRKRG
jgi:hypothetical protein